MTGLTNINSAGILSEHADDIESATRALHKSTNISMFKAMVGRGPLGMLMRQDMAVQLHKDRRQIRHSTSGDTFISKVAAEYKAFRDEFVFYKDTPLVNLGQALEFVNAISGQSLHSSIFNTHYASLLHSKLTNDSIRVGDGVEVVSDSSGQKFHFNSKNSCLVSTHHNHGEFHHGDIFPRPRYRHESEDITSTTACGFLTYDDVCRYIGAVSEYCYIAYARYIEKRYDTILSFTERTRVIPNKLLASIEKYIDLKQQQENIKLAKQGMPDKSTPLSYMAINGATTLTIDYSRSVRDVSDNEWLKVEALDPEFISITHNSLSDIPKLIPNLKVRIVKLAEGSFKITAIKQPIARTAGIGTWNEDIDILDTGLYLSDAISRYSYLSAMAKSRELEAVKIMATNILSPMAACAVMLHLPIFEALPEAVDKQSQLVLNILKNTEV